MRHIYRIYLNDKKEAYEHLKTYNFQKITGITLELSRGFACVTIPMNAVKTQEDFLDFSTHVFRDAFRKAMQVHIIFFGRDLFMKSVTFEIDGEAVQYTSENMTGFPFVFSMLRGRQIKLTPADAWKALIKDILETPKSRQDQDLRFSAVFSYWAGKSRTYELDRFQNFWMAMNACYSYLNNLYSERLAKDDKIDGQLALWNKEKGSSIKKAELKAESENARINLLAHWITGTQAYIKKNDLQALWDKNAGRTGKSEHAAEPEYTEEGFRCYALERQLRNLSFRDLRNLYEAARTRDPKKLVRWQELDALANTVNTDLFCFLLLYLPYHYRNAFFHGNKSLCLFMSFNDYEYSVLHAVNLFLDRFLSTAIPGMFSETMLTDEAYESLKKYAFDATVKQK